MSEKAADLSIPLETKKRALPRRLYFKDSGFYYVYRNKWSYLCHTRLGALKRYINEFADSEELRREAAALMNTDIEHRRYMSQVFWRARKNANSRGIPFKLTREEFEKIVKRANGRCEVSGLTFDIALRPNSLRRPFSPSLDRIQASGCYEITNCRLVSCLVNAAMSDWGEEPFRIVARAMYEHDLVRDDRRYAKWLKSIRPANQE